MDNKMTALNEMELENVDGGFGFLLGALIAAIVGAAGAVIIKTK